MVKALLLLHNTSLNGNILWNMLFNFDKVHTKLKNEAWTQIVMCIEQAQKNCVRQVNIITFSDTKWMCIIIACIRGYFHTKNNCEAFVFILWTKKSKERLCGIKDCNYANGFGLTSVQTSNSNTIHVIPRER